jgi:hypothetical protein
MTCRDYERRWNELIDRDRVGLVPVDPVSDDPERALLDHAADCPACRQVGARYQVLRRALQAGFQPPIGPAGLADRVLDELSARQPSAWPVYGEIKREPLWPVLATLFSAIAASMLAIFLLKQLVDRNGPNVPKAVLHTTPLDPTRGDSSVTKTTSVDALKLNTAVADATAATWDLARLASEPAARISRQVVIAATHADRESIVQAPDARSESDAAGVFFPSLAALAPDTAAAEAMVRQVGDHLAIGVRPLSDTARHAFGFLLGPASAKPHVPANPPAPKGA